MNPRGRSVDDDLVNLGLILIAAVGLLAGVLRVAGSSRGLALRGRATDSEAGPPASASSADQATRAWRSEPAG